MRKIKFEDNEYYHIYNRGTDKRSIIKDEHDSSRFVKSLIAFNAIEPIGSIFKEFYTNPIILSNPVTQNKNCLVEIIAYCFNPNHFHLILKQVEDDGISKFMHKFGSGYTRFFNEKYSRNGVLFQGKFKARHIRNDYDLLRMSAYVNLNSQVHNLSNRVTQNVRSSWNEYIGNSKRQICSKDIVLNQFNSTREYIKFAEKTVAEIVKERASVNKSELVKLKKEFYGYYFD